MTIVRHLYNLALEQERKGDLLGGLALLPFHDAVELFLQVAAENHPKVKLTKSVEFMGYWPAFNAAELTLPYLEQMRRFNNARVEIKHRGTLPSRHDVEGFRATITAFLVEAAPKLFEIEFDSISLSALVRSEEVRSALQAAEAAAREERFPAALEHAAKAFRRSLRLHRYGAAPPTHDRRLFDPTDVARDLKWRGREIGESGTSRLLDAVAYMGQSLGEAITVIAYNLDYDGYRHILTYGPAIHEMVGGNMVMDWMKTPTTDKRIVDRCVAFAVDAALRLEGRADPADQS
ncbi:MAG: hypothetical protein KGQ37_07455 [Hyphomicrobiales bacterium]|nr:hypothetical protein [Hyphomicrobiales bacterium]